MLDFIGIGSRWAGEEWLYNQLRKHPEIRFPRNLELGFWSVHYLKSLEEKNYRRDLNWYSGIFGHWPDELPAADGGKKAPALHYQRSWFDRFLFWLDRSGEDAAPMAGVDSWAKHHHYKMGDFSPSYGPIDDERVLKAVKEFAPDAKLFYMIRHPAERAFTAAEQLRKVAGLGADEVSDTWYVDHFRSRQSHKHGDYLATLERWGEHFDASQLLIVTYEEAMAAPHTVLKRCAVHLGLKETDYFDRFDAEDLKAELLNLSCELSDSLRDALNELYAAKNQALFKQFAIDYRPSPAKK